MNPDMSRNDIFGMIDPKGMAIGEWRRKRDGVAAPGCRVALFDEIYKSSGQVRSMILEVLEEHHFTEGVTTIPLDLLLGIGASNELVDPTPRNADWDRFGIRYEIKYPTRVNDLKKLFTAGSGRIPIQTRLSPDEILLVQALVEVLSMNPSKKLTDTAGKILGELNDKELQVSPRRIQAWLRVTAAKALLERGEGVEVEPRDLLVGENILWITPESRQKVAEIVNGISDPDRQELMKVKADYETLRNQARKIASLSDQTTVIGRINTLKKFVEKKESTDFVDLLVQINELREKVLSIQIN
jgi:MoxR-like ATPase